jgi:coproporphyrinogen III oxidase-like Fe-S oxidoreductase
MIKQEFGENFLQELLNKTTILLQSNDINIFNNHIQLTQKGKLFADSIAADLFF